MALSKLQSCCVAALLIPVMSVFLLISINWTMLYTYPSNPCISRNPTECVTYCGECYYCPYSNVTKTWGCYSDKPSQTDCPNEQLVRSSECKRTIEKTAMGFFWTLTGLFCLIIFGLSTYAFILWILEC
jgi:hypothetical protein